MHFDGSDYQYLVGLNKQTGDTIWTTKRSVDFQDLGRDGKPQADGDFRKAFSTPVVANIDGAPVLLSLGSKAFYTYTPEDGKEIFRTENRACHSGSATPVFGNGLIYTCTGLAKGELWAIKPGGSGNVTDTHVVWKAKRSIPNKPSIVLVGDLIYMVDDGGIASCLDAKTGADVWRERIGGNFSASPIFADGKIYLFSEEGVTSVLEAGREFKKVAESKLDDGFLATPAFVDGAIILRTRTHLYRVEK
jgi:outer membrane protein assembly factor BamB